MYEQTSLERHLADSRADLAGVIATLGDVAAKLSDAISKGPLFHSHSALVGENTDGDNQTALDVHADDAFFNALSKTPTRWYLSEERNDVQSLDSAGTLAIAIDPLDGSSNIDTNVSIGTIFSIFEAGDNAEESFLRPAHEQVAAGYFIYGPQTALMLTLGNGVAMFVLDRASGTFLLANARVSIPDDAAEYAINTSNYRHWSKPIRAYIDDCVAGQEGPQARNFNMRWIASLVAETHRIMTRGGIFLYPADSRNGYERGRLRMVYECAPIAMLVEQAGGGATDACDRILDATAPSIHARTPLVFGSRDKVARVAAYHELPEPEIAPLFGKRGLFTA